MTIWTWFLVSLRMSEKAICKASKDMGKIDWHDYPDAIEEKPDYFHPMSCRRCGKKFLM